jgi:Helix-turn-helix of insertion element transposase
MNTTMLSAENIYAMWLAVPPSAREPRTQVELAEQLGVSQAALYRWREEPGFVEKSWQYALEWIRTERVVEVIEAMYVDATTGPLSSAKVSAARLVLETAGILRTPYNLHLQQLNLGSRPEIRVVYEKAHMLGSADADGQRALAWPDAVADAEVNHA